ncbi:neutral/alkaline non-lysosomal ceramidase N-terminal domain-containing protein [Paludisphaera rhizosphaerae]|uniref:neutral/alkaline non-lysosomal ceramidase N-terminal domain-containing protein n=1 Tax=Paludisphaera rhizosphaerae TaxID=2711216 RepID=UPI0013EA0828|nr:neutral/alkaline non-lysosomal ceramidase N-terminal domain-containing protein [Paludisphaera rhizosphaerae]
MRWRLFAAGIGTLLGFAAGGLTAGELKVGAAASKLAADDAMVIGGSIGPGKAKGQEGELRASAVVIQDPQGAKVVLVECDVLMVERDVLDSAAKRIAEATGAPFDNVLINATHTHHAPTTVTVHGYQRDEGFAKQVGDRAVEAAVAADRRLAPASMSFRLGEESSVGRNSRLLLANGMIFWVGAQDDVVRPTGPFDPELPVWAFRRPDGSLEALLFNHSTHTIGARTPGLRSPGFYGLAAQELEKELGGTALFFEGASGSTHNLELKADEMTLRIKNAVRAALAKAEPKAVDRVRGLRKEVVVKVRDFDEAREDAAVAAYEAHKVKDAKNAQFVIDTFRDMRRGLASKRGEERKTWVQAVRIGEFAVVGVPAEFFTVLGQDIKRRSPFRYTYVFELANDYIGYTPDRKAFDLGGYQTWTGFHSYTAPGTGEMLAEEALGLLKTLHDEP